MAESWFATFKEELIYGMGVRTPIALNGLAHAGIGCPDLDGRRSFAPPVYTLEPSDVDYSFSLALGAAVDLPPCDDVGTKNPGCAISILGSRVKAR